MCLRWNWEGPAKRVDVGRPDRDDVEAAFRTIIRWAGDDPERPGLAETPARVARAFEEFFAGYGQDPAPDFGEDLRGNRRL